MGIEISIEGLDDVLEAIGRLDDAELRKAAYPGLRKGLELIRGDAAANAPVDTGDLRQRMASRIKKEGATLVGEVYSGAPHGIYVEMGTGPKGEASHAGVNPEWASKVTYKPDGWYAPIKGEVRFVRGMPARPFLYPAFKANEQKARDEITKAVIKHVQGG